MVDPISPNTVGPLPSEPPPSDMGSPQGNPPPPATPPAEEVSAQTSGNTQATGGEAPPPDPEAGSLERRAALALAARQLPANEASARALAMLARNSGVGVDRAADALLLGVRLGMPPTMAQLSGLAGALEGASSFGKPLREALSALSEIIRLNAQEPDSPAKGTARASGLLATAARVRANLSNLLPMLDTNRGVISLLSPPGSGGAASSPTIPGLATLMPAPGQGLAAGQGPDMPASTAAPSASLPLPMSLPPAAPNPTAPPPVPDLLGGTLTALIELENAGLDHIRSLPSLDRLDQVIQALRMPRPSRGTTTNRGDSVRPQSSTTSSQLPPFARGTAIALETLIRTGSLTPPEMAARSEGASDGFQSLMTHLVGPLDDDQRAALLERLANLETRLVSEDSTLLRLRRVYSGLRTVSERMVSLHTAAQLSRDGDPPMLTILPLRVDGGPPHSILVKVERRRRGRGEKDADGDDTPAPLCKIDLETPHLGPVEISLDLPGDKAVDVGFAVSTGAVVRLFQRHLGDLQQRLQGRGIRTVKSHVRMRDTPEPPHGEATDQEAKTETAPWAVSGLVLDLLGGNEILPSSAASPRPLDMEG